MCAYYTFVYLKHYKHQLIKTNVLHPIYQNNKYNIFYPFNTFLYRTFYVVFLFYYYNPQISHIVHLDERDAIQKNVSVFK